MKISKIKEFNYSGNEVSIKYIRQESRNMMLRDVDVTEKYSFTPQQELIEALAEFMPKFKEVSKLDSIDEKIMSLEGIQFKKPDEISLIGSIWNEKGEQIKIKTPIILVESDSKIEQDVIEIREQIERYLLGSSSISNMQVSIFDNQTGEKIF